MPLVRENGVNFKRTRRLTARHWTAKDVGRGERGVGLGHARHRPLYMAAQTRLHLNDRRLPHLERVPAETAPYGESGDGFANCRDGLPCKVSVGRFKRSVDRHPLLLLSSLIVLGDMRQLLLVFLFLLWVPIVDTYCGDYGQVCNTSEDPHRALQRRRQR